MKHFTILKVYELDDVNFVRDTLEVRLIDGLGVVMKGDWYHNNIDHKIEGFFEGLKYAGVEYKVETVQVNMDI